MWAAVSWTPGSCGLAARARARWSLGFGVATVMAMDLRHRDQGAAEVGLEREGLRVGGERLVGIQPLVGGRDPEPGLPRIPPVRLDGHRGTAHGTGIPGVVRGVGEGVEGDGPRPLGEQHRALEVRDRPHRGAGLVAVGPRDLDEPGDEALELVPARTEPRVDRPGLLVASEFVEAAREDPVEERLPSAPPRIPAQERERVVGPARAQECEPVAGERLALLRVAREHGLEADKGRRGRALLHLQERLLQQPRELLVETQATREFDVGIAGDDEADERRDERDAEREDHGEGRLRRARA